MYYDISRRQLKVADSYFHAQDRGEGPRTLPQDEVLVNMIK